MTRLLLALAALAAGASALRAGLIVRIGDKDGFGYKNAPGFRAANGGPANANGGDILNDLDFLPDVNRNGNVATGAGDDFDLRSALERAGTVIEAGSGVSNTAGTLGSAFTDISLSTSYDTSRQANRVLIGGNPNTGLTFGAGGAFPSPPSTTLPNQPGFVFAFDAAKSEFPTPTPIFFNLLFGDYDVVPASIVITRANGTTRTLGLTQQDNAAGQNGLIQAATATLDFSDVFTDGGAVWRGALRVDFVAPNEPYTAFDYVELSTVALVAIPEPATLTLAGIGLATLGLARVRQRRGRMASPR